MINGKKSISLGIVYVCTLTYVNVLQKFLFRQNLRNLRFLSTNSDGICFLTLASDKNALYLISFLQQQYDFRQNSHKKPQYKLGQ